MINVLFVCLGNICRSPSGEGVFRALVKEDGLEQDFFIDSAGTSAYHAGDGADNRMKRHASRRNIQLTSLSRQLVRKDFEKFDIILAMDGNNYEEILSLDRKSEYRNKISMMTDYSTLYKNWDVPDPYYGGEAGFEEVLNILEESCRGLLAAIKNSNEF